ncbi:hypothetical protein CEUSTIGMA_g4067.t1 [Chlamydomonas eustigma]|uniref:Uncharacterized protein n=1 Tax=Chlamydomonas eustigma TaxID=1157962 RepID=A0A250X0L6_9CHLO|nr:hypothetical protein CEUSTIGMA_g4067.t1 [Chlamydomonas eustigma]|eukprot:GAX76621.1 hypothetical protein CEUSTIGMA_g4067.t1 [Chlamydomonas eustigma]
MLKRFSSTASRFGPVKQSGSHLEIILKSPRKYLNPTSYQTPFAQGVLFNKPNRKQGLTASVVTSGPGQPVTSQLAMEQNTDGIHRSRLEGSLPLQFKLGAVVSDRFGVLIDSLPAGAFSSPDPSNEDGGLVLGFNAGQGEESLLDIRIGQLNVQRMLVCARCKLWWMTPEWRTSTLKLPPETQFLLAELAPTTSTRLEGQDHGILVLNNTSSKRGQSAGAHYALLLPLIDGDFRCTLRAGR